MRTIRLHDTATGALAELVPRDPGRVGVYACGPTVYDRIHVGNARPFVVFSLLKRFLVHEGYEVTLVANVTDVNDKIYDAARPLGKPSTELAAEMTAAYVADTDALGLGRPDHEPLASQTIPGIVALIGDLIDRDAAYAVEGDVYFRVRADAGYGGLSGRDVDQMDQGEGVEGASRKEDPLDFALWKAAKPAEDTAWDAPWGAAAPAGTSSARRWPRSCSASASTSTAAASTSRSRTTRTRRRRPAAPAGPSSRASGCTTGCSRWAARSSRSRAGRRCSGFPRCSRRTTATP